MIVHFVVPGSIEQYTGGYLYDKYIVSGLGAKSHRVVVHELGGSFPFVDDCAKKHAAEVSACFKDKVVIDGLALPAFVDIFKKQSNFSLIALIHHPLAEETGLNPAEKQMLYKTEKEILTCMSRVIVTNSYMADQLIHKYAIESNKIGIVPPGTQKIKLVPQKNTNTINLLCVANLIERKGHIILLEALTALKELDWHLTCVGSMDYDHKTAQKIVSKINEHQLQHRICIAGAISPQELILQYQQADVFVLATFYEGYGMVLNEAVASGLPIVTTTGGAIAQVIPPKAAILVPPGNIGELRDALRSIICNHTLRAQLTQQSQKARENLTTWEQASSLFVAELEKVK